MISLLSGLHSSKSASNDCVGRDAHALDDVRALRPRDAGGGTDPTLCVDQAASRKLRVVGSQHLNDGELLERVRAFYDNGLWEIRDALGKMPRYR